MTPRGAVGRKRRDTSPTIAGQPLVTLVMVVVVCTVGCVRDVRACGCGCGSWSCAPCSVRGEIAQDTLGGSGGARAALERLCVVIKKKLNSSVGPQPGSPPEALSARSLRKCWGCAVGWGARAAPRMAPTFLGLATLY